MHSPLNQRASTLSLIISILRCLRLCRAWIERTQRHLSKQLTVLLCVCDAKAKTFDLDFLKILDPTGLLVSGHEFQGSQLVGGAGVCCKSLVKGALSRLVRHFSIPFQFSSRFLAIKCIGPAWWSVSVSSLECTVYGPSEHLSAKEDVSGKPDFLYETPFVVVRTYVYIHNRISKPWFSSIEHYYSLNYTDRCIYYTSDRRAGGFASMCKADGVTCILAQKMDWVFLEGKSVCRRRGDKRAEAAAAIANKKKEILLPLPNSNCSPAQHNKYKGFALCLFCSVIESQAGLFPFLYLSHSPPDGGCWGLLTDMVMKLPTAMMMIALYE